jgi:hypothetical protein
MSAPQEWRENTQRYTLSGTKCPHCQKFSMRRYAEGVPCASCGVVGHEDQNDPRSKGFKLKEERKSSAEEKASAVVVTVLLNAVSMEKEGNAHG